MLKENFVDTIEKSIQKNWDYVCFTDYNGSTVSYSDAAGEIVKIHLLFDKIGIQPHDKIALVGKNASNWAIAFLATITYDAVIVPILQDFLPGDITNIINHSDAVFLFAADSIYETLDQSKLTNVKASLSLTDFSMLYEAPGLDVKTKLEEAHTMFRSDIKSAFSANSFALKKVPGDHLAVISYTSGTTGFSKGVMLQHNSLMANVRFAYNNMPLQPGDKIVSFLPLAHSYGCAFEFLFPFCIGCHITFLTKIPSPKILIQAFEEVKPKLILSVPLVIEKIYKNQLMPVINKGLTGLLLKIPLLNKLIYKKIYKKLYNLFGGNFTELVVGGAAFNPDAEKFFHKIRFPFTVGYGMTECGPLISYASWKTAKLQSAGRPVDTLDIRIDSADPEHIPGEIMVRGDNVMLGYYKNKEATDKVLEPDGWLHTGDLGVMDKEKNIFIKGRSKSMILGASGQNIYPEEIEAKINNMLYVLESVVVERHNRLVALIYPDNDAMQKDGISIEQWHELMETNKKSLNAILPAFMNVSEFILHDKEFEKTPKKSIKRFLYS